MSIILYILCAIAFIPEVLNEKLIASELMCHLQRNEMCRA